MNKPLAASAILAIVLFAATSAYSKPRTASLAGYAAFPGLSAGDRLTVISPHLDDETLGAGGLIAQARRAGVPVSVIFMTNGDDNPIGANLQMRTGYATPDQLIRSGVERQKEALAALAALGVSRDDLYFLGLPDRNLKKLLLPANASVPYVAPSTLKSASPYELSYVPSLPYDGDSVRAALSKALAASRPTVVLTTMPQDSHTDHQATATFVSQVIGSTRLMYFPIHYKGYPDSRSRDLVPPAGLANLPWQVVSLDRRDIADKAAAVGRYGSQLRIPELGGLMRSMVRGNELLVPASH